MPAEAEPVIEILEGNTEYESVKRWYNEDGLLHRENDLPAEVYIPRLISPSQEENDDNDVPDLFEKYYRYGLLHRDGDLPAVIMISKDNTGRKHVMKKWYKNGMKHRDNGKPAYKIRMYSMDNVITYSRTVYYINDVINNINIDEPAVIIELNNAHTYKTWYINGKMGRADDKPAVENTDSAGNRIVKKWYFNDKLHRENDKPAIHEIINGHDSYTWYLNDKEKRENGGPTCEEWEENKLVSCSWSTNKYGYHRLDDLPAIISYYPGTDIIQYESWYVKDCKHRENGKPAKREYYEDGTIMKECYFHWNKLRRPNNLPTKVWYNKNGKPYKFRK